MPLHLAFDILGETDSTSKDTPQQLSHVNLMDILLSSDVVNENWPFLCP